MATPIEIPITFRHNGVIMVKDAANLLFARAHDYYCSLHFANGEVFNFSYTLKRLQDLLHYTGLFARVHRSYLVKLSEVMGYVRYKARLYTGNFIPLGRKGFAIVKAYLLG